MIDAISPARPLPAMVTAGDDIAPTDVFAALLSGLAQCDALKMPAVTPTPGPGDITDKLTLEQVCTTQAASDGPAQSCSDADGQAAMFDTVENPDTAVNVLATSPVFTGVVPNHSVVVDDVANVPRVEVGNKSEKRSRGTISVATDTLAPERNASSSGPEHENDRIPVSFDKITQTRPGLALVSDGGGLLGTGDHVGPRPEHAQERTVPSSYGMPGRPHSALDGVTKEVLAFANATEVEFDLHPARLGDVNVSILRDASGSEVRLRLETDQASLVVKHYQAELVRATDGLVRVHVEVDQGRSKQRRRRDSHATPEALVGGVCGQIAAQVRHA